jgi:histidinol-phosphatase (PHP family)
MMPSNYHTHTTFCHGNDTPEELVLKAIELGCPEIGFSCHAFTSFDNSYCMTREGTEQYKACVNELKQKYADKIKVRLGVEQDFYSDDTPCGYDYVIGSVQYLYKDGKYLSIDSSKHDMLEQIDKYYGGDIYTYACKISETQVLAVCVRVSGTEYEILRWQAVSAADWDAEDRLPVWDGQIP